MINSMPVKRCYIKLYFAINEHIMTIKKKIEDDDDAITHALCKTNIVHMMVYPIHWFVVSQMFSQCIFYMMITMIMINKNFPISHRVRCHLGILNLGVTLEKCLAPRYHDCIFIPMPTTEYFMKKNHL